ncbi:MAG TPA: hypothetical protein VJB59_00120 [Bdellovibrionota bacterium]|nr:hypothetical protein [Bdellovibrionota bacterium]
MSRALGIFSVCFLLSSTFLPEPLGRVHAGELAKKFSQVLPRELRSVVPGKTTRQEVLKTLGNPAERSEDGRAYYYELAGKRYDTSIEFAGETVYSVHFESVDSEKKEAFAFERVRPLIPETDLKRAAEQFRSASPTHEKGRIFEIRVPSESLTLRFRNNAKKSLQSIRLGTVP